MTEASNVSIIGLEGARGSPPENRENLDAPSTLAAMQSAPIHHRPSSVALKFEQKVAAQGSPLHRNEKMKIDPTMCMKTKSRATTCPFAKRQNVTKMKTQTDTSALIATKYVAERSPARPVATSILAGGRTSGVSIFAAHDYSRPCSQAGETQNGAREILRTN